MDETVKTVKILKKWEKRLKKTQQHSIRDTGIFLIPPVEKLNWAWRNIREVQENSEGTKIYAFFW